MTWKPASTIARERLARRAKEAVALTNNVTPDRLRKSPSQKKSESGRKKFLKRAGIDAKHAQPKEMYDCHTCPKYPCGRTLNICEERSTMHRCKSCGQKVTYRFDPNVIWEYCPPCKEKVKR